MRYFLNITYLGTHYHGWQIQPNALTIQGRLADKLSLLLSTPVALTGSSRTDKGVHAEQQWAHIEVPFDLELDKLQYKLNLFLPPDIAINGIYPVVPAAHARFDALQRQYTYRIIHKKNPLHPSNAYLFTRPLDLAKMNEAAALLTTHKNFKSMSKVGSSMAYPYLSDVYRAKWEIEVSGTLVFVITANRFLRGMVRAIVGNLLAVGEGQYTVEKFGDILTQQDHPCGAILAPACGLTLARVVYPEKIFL